MEHQAAILIVTKSQYEVEILQPEAAQVSQCPILVAIKPVIDEKKSCAASRKISQIHCILHCALIGVIPTTETHICVNRTAYTGVRGHSHWLDNDVLFHIRRAT